MYPYKIIKLYKYQNRFKKEGEKMSNFSTGLFLGAAFGVAVSMVVNPMDKKSMYKNCCKANRMVKKMNRSLNRKLHNFM